MIIPVKFLENQNRLSNLGRDNLKAVLHSIFVQYGPIQWISLMPKARKSGRNRSSWQRQGVEFALVRFVNREDAMTAQEVINNDYDSEIWCTQSPVRNN